MSTVVPLKPNPEGRRRVLVVEDNLDAVHSMAMLGFAALQIARAFKPHLILLDIGLPDFKGYDIATQLRWEPGLEQTRIIAITALKAVGFKAPRAKLRSKANAKRRARR